MPPERDSLALRTFMALVLLCLPVALFWRPGLPYFYILDDWTALIQMTAFSWWDYLVQPDGEQWFPFFKLVFYPLVHGAGENYALLLLVNCLGLGLNSFLVFLWLRRLFPLSPALAVSLLYTLAAAHHSLAWNAFYLCYLLSLTFFLLALLLTDSYGRRPSGAKLAALGVCALLSIWSHNYTLSGLLALPLYLVLLGGADKWRRAGSVAGALVAVYAVFAVGYLNFAGLPALTSHNLSIISRLPGPLYLVHVFYGAVLSPFLYLFWGHYHFPVWTYVMGVPLLAACLMVIWVRGEAWWRRLGLWALLLNILPFVLLSLARYQRSVTQAFVARYLIFTLIGAGILLAAAWSLLARRWGATAWFRGLTGLLVAAVLAGQFLSLPLWQKKYLDMGRLAFSCYQELSAPQPPPAIPPENFARFCPTAHPRLTAAQMLSIRRFLAGEAILFSPPPLPDRMQR